MSRLVVLHRALTDEFISSAIRAEGVAYLNSSEPLFPLRAAYAELVEDLDQAADSISRFALLCHHNWPRSFYLVYSEIKSGSGDFVLGFSSKELDKKIRMMERYVASTSVLHEGIKALTELEASMRNLQRLSPYSGPIIGGTPAAQQAEPPGADLLMKKLVEVRRLKKESLWRRSIDQVADLVSRAVVTLFARVCWIFGNIDYDLPFVVVDRNGRFQFTDNRRHHGTHRLRSYLRPWISQYLEPRAGTVGESGLTLRYANVVVLAEEMLQSPKPGKGARNKLYQLLPWALRKAVNAKLQRPEARYGDGDDDIAAGWRDATGRILQWIGPMAHDTVRWHSERSYERQKFEDPSQDKVLLVQTLQFADREKTEVAIVEVLVGLSCFFRYQRRTSTWYEEEDDDDDDW